MSSLTIEERIIFLLEKICQYCKNHNWEIAYKEKLTPTQIDILKIISVYPNVGVSLLSKELRTSKATISESVKVLIEKGIIRASKKEKDRRRICLSLTAKGKNIVRRLNKVNEIMKELLKGINKQEKINTYKFLLSFVKNLKERDNLWVVRICAFCSNAKVEHRQGEKLLCTVKGEKIHSTGYQINCPYFKIPTS